MEDVDVDVTQDGNVQGKMISDGDYDGKMSPFQLVSRPTMYTIFHLCLDFFFVHPIQISEK